MQSKEKKGESYKVVDSGSMDFILVNAIKERQAQIEVQKLLLKEIQAELSTSESVNK